MPVERLRAYLELARPANVVTAFADVLAGFAAAGAFLLGFETPYGGDLFYLLAATGGLYAGGVVFNDVFDAPLDARERPERPIPSGRIPQMHAAVYGSVLLAIGLAAALAVGLIPFMVALAIAIGALTYDAAGKHHALLGPINMGACRGANLLLGASVLPGMLYEIWYIGLIPVAYIGAVTAISRGEVHGGSRGTGTLAVCLAAVVTGGLLLLGLRLDYRTLHALPFLAIFGSLVFPPFVQAAARPSPDHIRKAVRTGVLALVAMDATLAAGFAGWAAGLTVLLLLPVSLGMAKLFAVT
ncbi:MAG: UbiA-like protein EboC [Rhodothermales bacterium]